MSSSTLTQPLPPRPNNNITAKADSIGLGGPKTAETALHAPTAAQALAGSNRDIVANRRAIRMANMSAAEMLKAELAGLMPVKPTASAPSKSTSDTAPANLDEKASEIPIASHGDDDVPGLNGSAVITQSPPPSVIDSTIVLPVENDIDAEGEPDPNVSADDLMIHEDIGGSPRGQKRPIDEVDDVDEDEEILGSDDDDVPVSTSLTLKVNPDGTVEQEDLVKYVARNGFCSSRSLISIHRLWEPGYKERYYRQKFGVEYSDVEFRKQ